MEWCYKDLIETLVRFKEEFPDCGDYELMIRFKDKDGTPVETTLAVFPSVEDYEDEEWLTTSANADLQ